MSSLRSDRARRRASRLRTARIVVILLIFAAILAAAYFLWYRQAPETGNIQSEFALMVMFSLSSLHPHNPLYADLPLLDV